MKSRLTIQRQEKNMMKPTAFAAFVAPISTLLDLVADLLRREAFLSVLAPEQAAVLFLLQLFFRGEKQSPILAKPMSLKGTENRGYCSV
jgi:hypothetical protein